MERTKILILCTGNSARSQMAEGLLRHDAGDRFEVESAGTQATSVRPEAIAVMKELGIDVPEVTRGLPHGVCGALEPAFAFRRLLGGDDFDETP